MKTSNVFKEAILGFFTRQPKSSKLGDEKWDVTNQPYYKSFQLDNSYLMYNPDTKSTYWESSILKMQYDHTVLAVYYAETDKLELEGSEENAETIEELENTVAKLQKQLKNLRKKARGKKKKSR